MERERRMHRARRRERGCGGKGEEGGTGQRREREQERVTSDGSSETWRLLQGNKTLQTWPSKLTVSHLSQSAEHSHSPRSGLMWDIGQCSITLNTLSQISTFFSMLHSMCVNESPTGIADVFMWGWKDWWCRVTCVQHLPSEQLRLKAASNTSRKHLF